MRGISRSGPLRALGAMSGTSMDGVDAAVVVTDGREILEFGETAYTEYAPEDRRCLRDAQGSWDAPEAEALVTRAHEVALSGVAADLVGFHGQTLAHDPANKRTYQAGDGEALARALNLPVVWDFRTADIELGGQGAPLAPFFHHAAARWAGLAAPVVFLNLGGVGNVTYVDPTVPEPQDPKALLAFDTGPANAILDDLMAVHGCDFDARGELARSGMVSAGLLDDALLAPYFSRPPPKSLDRNAFSGLTRRLHKMPLKEAMATAAAFTASSVILGLSWCPAPPARVLVAGGGRKNLTVMEMLRAGADCPVDPVEEVGLDGDFLEAQAFAFLAVRVARGLPTSAPTTTGVGAPVGGGTLSLPGDR